MPFIADFHVHSKYSRATSRDMCPEGLWKGAQLKGISVIGTGDFTHPAWLRDLSEKLEPAGNGLFSLRKEHRVDGVPSSCASGVHFILSAEISCIFSRNGRTRKVHAVVLMPDLASVARLNDSLGKIGNLASDGRPILGLDAKELLRMTLDASPDSLFIPAHAWTPHFSVFGAASGFDSLEECFGDLAPEIRAIETGLSSDPAMNWRLSQLDGVTLVSNSDAHSTAKLGREANVLETELSYGAITDAIRTGRGFQGTIEFFPEEGKYHFDGHRNCGVSFTPAETVRHGFRCPVCGGKLTVGVMHRVEKLADREPGFRPDGAPPYTSIVPLPELIADALGAGTGTKKVNAAWLGLIERLGPEFTVLRETPLAEIERAGSPLLREAVDRMRSGRIAVTPGYDGEFGRVRVFTAAERETGAWQAAML